jgi:acetyl esterase/lipase
VSFPFARCARLSLVLALAAPVVAQVEPTFSDLSHGPHPRQRLDLYLPPGPGGPWPLVVWIHGGGWQSGDKYPAGKAGPLRNAGFAVASVNYRLSSDATFPAQIHDCKAALRWLRAQSVALNLDAARVATWGSSAGGHLSALLGVSGNVPGLEGAVGGNLTYSSRVQAAAVYFGPANLFTMGGWHDECDSPESRLIGECLGEIKAHLDDPDWAEWVALVEAASPVYHVTGDDPPFHIAHGTADGTVPPGQSAELYAALAAAGVPATLRLVPGAGHGLPASEDAYVLAFLQAELGPGPVRGDLNCDGEVSFGDVNPFVLALTGELAYVTSFPACNWYDADVDGDGRVAFLDINPFVALLAGG